MKTSRFLWLVVPVLTLIACSGDNGGGTGGTPECSLDKTSLEFGSVFISATADLTITITNTGTGTLSGTVSSPCADFTILGSADYSLAEDESKEITIRFTPSATGMSSCTIQTGSGLCGTISAGGEGVNTCCSITPDHIDFGGVIAGQTMDSSFVITNCGNETISGTISESCGEYTILSGGGAYSLAPGLSRTVTVQFAPTILGLQQCDIATGSTVCGPLSLTGNGTEVRCFVDPNEIDFDSVAIGEFKDTTFVITNIGTATLVGNIGEVCPEFRIIQGTSYNLPPDEVRNVIIRFEPQSAGNKSCGFDTGNDLCSDVFTTGIGFVPVDTTG